MISLDKFECNARLYERKFKRYVEKHGSFCTVNGAVNTIVDYGKHTISLITESGSGKVNKLSRQKLREEIPYVFFKRNCTRMDLDKQNHRFTSAMLGILFKIFEDIAYIQRLVNGLVRLVLKGVRFHFSGIVRGPEDIKLIKENGGHFGLMDFYNIRKDKTGNWLRYLTDNQMYCLVDSGAWSVYSANQKRREKSKQIGSQLELFPTDENITVEDYARFINQYKAHPLIVGFFNLDVIHNPVATKENYKKLVSLTHHPIIPVWQCNDSFDSLHQLVNEEHELIAIGGTVPLMVSGRMDHLKAIFTRIFEAFPTQPFHWLGGANHLLQDYNWFSGDSSAWMNARKNGTNKLYMPDGRKVNDPDHMSVLEIMKQNICYFASLEDSYEAQLSFSL